MRRSVATGRALFPFVAALPWVAAAACAGSSDQGQTHGPVYEFDGGSTFVGDAVAQSDSAPATAAEASTADAFVGHDAATPDAGDTGTGGEDDAGSASDAPACSSAIAVLAGSGSSLAGAVAQGSGAFTVQALSGSASYAPALAAVSNGFEALVPGGGGVLFGVGVTGATWSSPAALGGGASTIDSPAVALSGTTLHGIYLSPQNLYFHAQFNGASWDTGADKVVPPVDGGAQSFGPVRASVAASSTELVMAYEGDDAHLYAQSWTLAGGWEPAVKIGTGSVETNTAPALVALVGDTSDFLVAYAVASTTSTNYINYALRDATSKAWSAAALTNIDAYTPNAPSLASLANGHAIVGWRGANGLAYTMELTPGATPTWTAPVPIASVNVTSAPSLATGVCGQDAVAALATEGAVTIAGYAAGGWIPPTPIPGISGATFAAIATRP